MGGFRYEYKFIITKNLAKVLEQKLSLLLKVDNNSINKDRTYFIRSVYFDDSYSTSYYEKIDGIEYRKKYRIRLYNNDLHFIRLECKYKYNNLTKKESTKITKEMCEDFIKGNFEQYYINNINDKILRDFIIEAKTKGLKPVVIVDYDRMAFVGDLSDLRITIDKDIRSNGFNINIFNNIVNSYGVLEDEKVVLEVKFNDFIPEYISNVLSTIPSYRQAISKFASCRSIL